MNRNEPGKAISAEPHQGDCPVNSKEVASEGLCPPDEWLRAAALGEAETMMLDSLAEHLNTCESCIQRIESILREQRLIGSSTRVSNRRSVPSASDRPTANRPYDFAWDDEAVWVGRYRLGPCIGQGGIGKVYEATDTSLGRVVAIKRLRLELLTPKSLERFEREARSQAALNHPNIVALHEFGHDHGFPYLVMERVVGESLSRRISAGPLAPKSTAALMISVARAIAHAHRKGLVHRDLKPSNILLATVEDTTALNELAIQVDQDLSVVPKIADFGLARVFNDDSEATRTDDFAGTIAFMAPELVSSDPVPANPLSDIYSLGVILYVCLTGRHPFQGQDPPSTMAMIRDLDPVAPSLLIPGLPQDLETICLKCLEKPPGRRYATADDLADDLQRFLVHRPIKARPANLWTRGSRWCRRQPGTAAAVCVSAVSLFLMAIGGWVTAGIQSDLKAIALKNQAEAQRQARDAELARIAADKRRELAQNQFMQGTSAIFRLGMILDTYAENSPENAAFATLRKQFRKDLVLLTDQFLRDTGGSGESPSLMAQVLNTATVAHAMDGNFDRAETLFAELEDSVHRAEASPGAPANIRFHVMNAASRLADAYASAGKYGDAIRILKRCWNEWPIDPADPKVPPVLIRMRRELAFHLTTRLREIGLRPLADEYDKHVAELDMAYERRTKNQPN